MCAARTRLANVASVVEVDTKYERIASSGNEDQEAC